MQKLAGVILIGIIAIALGFGASKLYQHFTQHVLMITEVRGHYIYVSRNGREGPDTYITPNKQIQPWVPPFLSTPLPPSLIAPLPTPIDPKAMTYSGTVLYYFCGDNIAIAEVYVNLQGRVKIYISSRWDYYDTKWYLKKLALLEALVDVDDPNSKVSTVELSNRCMKS